MDKKRRRSMKSLVQIVLALGILGALVIVASAAEETKEDAAVRAADAWLALVDRGDYRESWDDAAQLFKNAITKEQWETQLQAARQPLGKLVSRRVKSTQYAESLPGAPDGEYVVIQYETSFEKKKSAIETVTPMLDPDGDWRVSGYFIK
jgi:hypothetical protein